MSDARRTILVRDGGDWNDASAELLSIPASIDLDAEHIRWREWYEQEYLPAFFSRERLLHMSFEEWLVSRCQAYKDTSIEEFRVP